MKVDLSKYAGMNICVAVSGGRDSMALLHFLTEHAKEYGITLSAINFDHMMREDSSAKDSAFVADYCRRQGVPLLFYKWDEPTLKTETSARLWRLKMYALAATPHVLPDGNRWQGADAIATAHHLNDNAETVLFNLARGCGMSGLTGIDDVNFTANDSKDWRLIRPLIGCSRQEIDTYIAKNSVPFVEDETNGTDNYTRNKIRHNVLPELEKAVTGAAKSIYRLSRIAAEDEEYFKEIIEQRGIIRNTSGGYEILNCTEKPIFKRAVLQVISECGIKDYTFEQLERLYLLQFAKNGKKFEFLGLTAFKEEGKIVICIDFAKEDTDNSCLFLNYLKEERSIFLGQNLYIGWENSCSAERLKQYKNPKVLKFDLDKIPQSAVIRTMKACDKFKKFGGGTKNLGDYFTDKKIPVRLRKAIPVVADGSQVLIVCGMEIADTVKIDSNTKRTVVCVAENVAKD